jgi:UDP-glucuronate 4-epimerase
MGNAVLLTGAAGFIGFHVARALLRRGERVIGIDNLNSYYDPTLKQARLSVLRQEHGSAFDFRRIDFAEPFEISGFDRIVHLGAQPGVRNGDPHAYIRSNITGHMNILELAKRASHLVYASSSSVYGANPLPFMEMDQTDRPISIYGATKKSGELLSESYSRLYDIRMTGLRFFTVYGPWGRPDMAMWTFTKAISEGRPINLFNNGNMKRDFTYIDDIVGGVLACLDSPPRRHTIYNIGNNRSEPLSKVVSLIEQALGKKAVINHLPIQPGETTHTLADITAIQRAHGFSPQTSIEQGIPRFADWYTNYAAERESRCGAEAA